MLSRLLSPSEHWQSLAPLASFGKGEPTATAACSRRAATEKCQLCEQIFGVDLCSRQQGLCRPSLDLPQVTVTSTSIDDEEEVEFVSALPTPMRKQNVVQYHRHHLRENWIEPGNAPQLNTSTTVTDSQARNERLLSFLRCISARPLTFSESVSADRCTETRVQCRQFVADDIQAAVQEEVEQCDCGEVPVEIINLPDLSVLKYYVEERRYIARAKHQGLPRPWTADPILQRGKFTNVHRADDHSTRYFIDNILPQATTFGEMLLNSAVFFLYGSADFHQHAWGIHGRGITFRGLTSEGKSILPSESYPSSMWRRLAGRPARPGRPGADRRRAQGRLAPPAGPGRLCRAGRQPAATT